MTGETYPSDNNEANFIDEVAFIPDDEVNEAVPVSDETVDEVVEKAEAPAGGEKNKLGRKAFLGTLAAAIAFANGCSKDKLPESSPSKTGDEGTKITDTATDTTESAVDIDTSTVTVTETSETEKKKGKAVVEKAVGEYDSYNDCFVYTPENIEIIPGDDYRDHTYDDLNEIKKYVSGEYPGGYLNVVDWLGEIGVDSADIVKNGDDIIISNDNNAVSIEIGSQGGVGFLVNGKVICRYKGGNPTTKNKRVYLFESTPDKQFSYLTTMPAESVDVLEVFANAYISGSTDNPLANVA